VGEFSGGAVFVTPDEIRGQDACGFLDDCTKAFQRRTEAARLIQEAGKLGVQPEDLDDAVHDAANVPASEINNGGLDNQIPFLVEELGTEETQRLLEEVAASKNKLDQGENR
jgi:hypothetical protein